MTQFSLNDIANHGNDSPVEKPDINQLLDKQQNGFTIETMVNDLGMGYLEATTQFMEENSIPETMVNKFIPSGIIEKIMSEAIDENMLRPSVARGQKTSSLDFLL